MRLKVESSSFFLHSQKESFSPVFIYEPCMNWSAEMHLNLESKLTNQSETREAGPFWSFIKVSLFHTSDKTFFFVSVEFLSLISRFSNHEVFLL